MAVRVGKIVLHGWQTLELAGGFSDTFIFPISPRAGIPPMDYAKVIRRVVYPLLKLRRSASLWVPVDGEGRWYREQLRRSLRGLGVPVVVTEDGQEPAMLDFSFRPWTDRHPSPPPPHAGPLFHDETLRASEMSCLRVLARIGEGSTAEIASLANLSLPTARKSLEGLIRWRLVALFKGRDTYPRWRVGRKGVSLALRSWGIPTGVSFPERRERSFSKGRHLRIARLWPAWLRKAWPQADIWAGWSEVSLGKLRPDALGWGRLQGVETLFWLEVEAGKRSRQDLHMRTQRRFNRALVYTRSLQIALTFVVLGPRWVCRAAMEVFINGPKDASVVLADWRSSDSLPLPIRGRVTF